MAERDRAFKVVLYDADYLFAVNILKNLYLGPGEPGPGDEWKIPSGPSDEMVTEEDRTVEPANSSRVSLLRRLTRKR